MKIEQRDEELEARLVKYDAWMTEGKIPTSSKVIPVNEALCGLKWVWQHTGVDPPRLANKAVPEPRVPANLHVPRGAFPQINLPYHLGRVVIRSSDGMSHAGDVSRLGRNRGYGPGWLTHDRV